MKKLLGLSCGLILGAMITVAFPCKAASVKESDIPVTIKVNDQYIKTDAKPFLQNSTTFVPIRFVSEALRADDVSWNSQTRTATVISNGKKIELPVNKNYVYVNGQYTSIREGVKLVNNRTFVPLRVVSEIMGAQVNWTQKTYTVNIYKQGVAVPASVSYQRSYTDEDLEWLAKIIHAEARGESLTGKIAVGNVIMNRVASKEFPNTVWGVIFDKKYGTQFEPVANGTIYNTPSYDSVVAAKRALEGHKVVGNSLYFMNPRIAQSSWIARNRVQSAIIGNHVFYL